MMKSRHTFGASLDIKRKRGEKAFAMLVDPDRYLSMLQYLEHEDFLNAVDYLLVGGSLLTTHQLGECLEALRIRSALPVILFPGSQLQIHQGADGILLLSLVSGRNPDFLIGRHVEAAASLKASGLEIIPTAYLLIDGGKSTTASYISNTHGIPHHKPEIAAATALASKMLGLKNIYLDAGSGARIPVSTEMIRAVRKAVDLPLIIGGGIRSAEKAIRNFEAGADLVVVGDLFEKSPSEGLKFLSSLAQYKKMRPVN